MGVWEYGSMGVWEYETVIDHRSSNFFTFQKINLRCPHEIKNKF